PLSSRTACSSTTRPSAATPPWREASILRGLPPPSPTAPSSSTSPSAAAAATNASARAAGHHKPAGTPPSRTVHSFPTRASGGSNNTGSDSTVGQAIGGGIANTNQGILFLTGSMFSGNTAVGGSNNTSTGGNGFIAAGDGGALVNAGEATVIDTSFEDNEARGGSGNRGDGTSFQFVGTAFGGGIYTSAG